MKVMLRTNAGGSVVDARPYDPTCPDVCWSSGEWRVLEAKDIPAAVASIPAPVIKAPTTEDRIADLEARVARLEGGRS